MLSTATRATDDDATRASFREMTFEISGGRPRIPHIAFVMARPGMTVRVETLQFAGDSVWEIARVSGSPADVAGLADVLAAPPCEPVGAVDHVVEDARTLKWIVRWERPGPGGIPSLFHIVYDALGPDAIVTPRIADGRIQVRVACRSAADLSALHGALVRTFGGRFDVKLTRIGEPRAERACVAEEDRILLAKALEAGYYDEPKRVGVRELGEVLGWSKTVISRKLRALERRAIEQMATAE